MCYIPFVLIVGFSSSRPVWKCESAPRLFRPIQVAVEIRASLTGFPQRRHFPQATHLPVSTHRFCRGPVLFMDNPPWFNVRVLRNRFGKGGIHGGNSPAPRRFPGVQVMKQTITLILLLLASSLVAVTKGSSTAPRRFPGVQVMKQTKSTSRLCSSVTKGSSTEAQAGSAPAGMSSSRGQDYQSFTFEEAKTFHRLFDYPFTAWTEGGDFSRYVFLNMSEFWGHILLSRKGRPTELRVVRQKAIADFRASVEGGERNLV